MKKIKPEDLYDITFGKNESYSCFVDAKDICYHAIPRDCTEHISLKEKDKNDYRRSNNKT